MIQVEQVKVAARGRWPSILIAAGLPEDCLTGKNCPCPKCGGTNRFAAFSDVAETGGVNCRHCHNKNNADGVATVQWWRDCSFQEALAFIAEQVGLTGKPAEPIDIIAETARDKRMPVEAFKIFGVKEAKRGRSGMRVARVDVYDSTGKVHSHFDLSPKKKGYCKRGKGNAGMFFQGRLPKAGETWLLVEGVKDAAALVGLGFNAAGMPTNKLASKYARLFAGVNVIIVHDLDLAGISGSSTTAANLLGIAKSVAIARLPGQVKEKQGDDVRDVLHKPDGEQLVREAIDAATTWKPTSDDAESDERPKVIVTMKEATVTDQVVSHIGNLGWNSPWIKLDGCDGVRVFVRGGVLVHAIESDDVDDQGRLTVRNLPPCLVRERITQACALAIEKEKDDEIIVIAARPPGWLIDAIFRRGSYGGAVRPLSGIIQSPTIRVDGSIVQTAGYDSQTGLIYRPSVAFPIVPDTPTKDDASKALLELLAVLSDFPMFSEADRSAWVAMVLSMIGRSCIDGYVPLFAVTANIRGAGKSLLVDAATLIAYGHRAARKAFTRDDDEMRKVITAIAIAATPNILFDNVDVQLGGAALDAAITSSVWSDRILGQSRMTGDLPMRTVWSATGNNLSFGSDISRRVLPIRLQSALETPEDRSVFVHPNLLGWVESQRPVLAVAALTMLRAYFVAGCPSQSGDCWGSFESWSSKIRGAIVWAGGADPLPTRETALAADDNAILLGKLIVGIEQTDQSDAGLTTKEIERMTFGCDSYSTDHETLLEAVVEICGDRFDGRKFGRRVRGLTGRVWKGRFIEGDSAGGGVKRWRVRSAQGGLGGFGGSNSAPSQSELKLSGSESNIIANDNNGSQNREQPRTNPPNQPNPSDDDWGDR